MARKPAVRDAPVHRQPARRGRQVFIDTGYLVALVNHADQHHATAVALGTALAGEPVTFITTHAVLLEVGSLLSKLPFRPYALQIFDVVMQDPQITVVPLSVGLYERGLVLFRARVDKSWSLTDCLSFVVMGDHHITDALAHDEHFEQAGFRSLMRRPV